MSGKPTVALDTHTTYRATECPPGRASGWVVGEKECLGALAGVDSPSRTAGDIVGAWGGRVLLSQLTRPAMPGV